MSDLDLYLQQSNFELEIDGFLEHFGIRGQRWGVRNKRAQVGNARRPNRVKSINRAFQKHPMATRLGVAAATGGIAVGVGLLMNKFKAKSINSIDNDIASRAKLSLGSQATNNALNNWGKLRTNNLGSLASQAANNARFR